MNSQKVKFNNTEGLELTASLELPADQSPIAYALFAHCFTCNKNLTAVINIARALTLHGFGVLRFDFTGLGESEGDFSDTDFSSNIGDLEDAARFMEENFEVPKLLVGHSLGGAATIFAGKSIPSVEAIATIGAPASPRHIQHLFKSSIEEINESGRARVDIGGREFTIKKQFIDDISEKNMSETVKLLRKPLLIMHSPQDATVDVSNAAEIFTIAMHPKSFVSLDGADHLLSNKKDSVYVGNVIAEWAARYIETPQRESFNTNKQVAVKIGSDNYTTDILAGKHAMIADEPESVGGNDYGPSPYDFLLAALGACTAMTLRMYADRKKWKLEEVTVHLDHKKDYARDCSQCEDSNSKVDQIGRSIEIVGDLDNEQKQRLIEIADRCPVHKTLHNHVEVQTELIEN